MTALAAGVLGPVPARAQSADQQINAIQRQIQQLQRELLHMKRDLGARDAAVRAAQADANRAREEAQQARQAAEARPVNPFPMPPPQPTPGPGIVSGFIAPSGPPASLGSSSPAIITQTEPKPIFRVGNLTVSLGGFAALEGLVRSRNEVTSIGSNFNTGIPFNNVPAAHQSEFRFTSQQSRLAGLVEGQPDAATHVAGYVETDLLGAAPTANSNESNSYNVRLRQFYGTYDRADWNFHLLFGQAWSLATLYKVGLVPRQENIPLTIDAQYVPGFTWSRQPQIRLSEDFDDHKLWAALSFESAQTTYNTGPNGSPIPGATVTTTTPGIAQLTPGQAYSDDIAPDMVVKLAADPGYGHYELFGLGRLMRTRVSTLGSGSNSAAFGGGAGGGFILPLLGNAVQLQGSALAGEGIGRYGSAQLPDATIGRNGEPVPIPEAMALLGLVGHPNKAIDLYAYLGAEEESKKAFALAGKGYGYGSPLYSNAGCQIELSTLPCVGNTSGVVQGTIGEWWRWLHGEYGTMMLGTQYSYTRRAVFKGVGGSPAANENIFMLSMRYYPFQ